MIEEPLTIECKCHGKKYAASVCGHIVNNNNQALGFIENVSDPEDLQGWCYACEHVYLQENDRTEKFMSFFNPAIVCSDCYKEIKAKHFVSA